MTHAELLSYLTTKAEAVSGIGSSVYGWVSDVNANIGALPCFYFQPPVEDDDLNGVIRYNAVYYLIDTGRASSGEGVEMTMAEKDTKWDVLKGYVTTWIRSVLDKDNQIAEFGKKLINVKSLKVSRDEQLSNKDDLFLQIRLTIETINARC